MKKVVDLKVLANLGTHSLVEEYAVEYSDTKAGLIRDQIRSFGENLVEAESLQKYLMAGNPSIAPKLMCRQVIKTAWVEFDNPNTSSKVSAKQV